ncbi:MAG: hypothetical protein Q8O44_04165, partial [Syntrophales bacterium]|nr:hypothetical protein [Syntrophales bacterium]
NGGFRSNAVSPIDEIDAEYYGSITSSAFAAAVARQTEGTDVSADGGIDLHCLGKEKRRIKGGMGDERELQ